MLNFLLIAFVLLPSASIAILLLLAIAQQLRKFFGWLTKNDARTILRNRRFLKNSFLFFSLVMFVSGLVIWNNLPQKKNAQTILAFNKAVLPASFWCQENFGADKLYLDMLNEYGEPNTSKKVTNCITSIANSSNIIEQIQVENIKQYERVKFDIETRYADALNKIPELKTYTTLKDYGLFLKPAYTGDVELDEYGKAFLCSNRERYFIVKNTIISEDGCFEIDWISYKKFKMISDNCYGICNASIFIDNNQNILGLKLEPLSKKIYLERMRNHLINELDKIKYKVNEKLANITPRSPEKFSALVNTYWPIK